jgi:hypothetical protein
MNAGELFDRLDILSSTVANRDARIPALTHAILDLGTLAAQPTL